jgi:hypothetical protein
MFDRKQWGIAEASWEMNRMYLEAISLNETSPTPLGINPLETLIFLPLKSNGKKVIWKYAKCSPS